MIAAEIDHVRVYLIPDDDDVGGDETQVHVWMADGERYVLVRQFDAISVYRGVDDDSLEYVTDETKTAIRFVCSPWLRGIQQVAS